MLLLKLGPQSPDDLQARLRDEGIVIGIQRLVTLPVRYADRFAELPDGRLSAALGDSSPSATPPTHQHGHSLDGRAIIPALEWSRVAVFDTETTGLKRGTDQVWELAAIRLDGSEELHLRIVVNDEFRPRVPVDASDVPEVTFADALNQFDEFVGRSDLVLGQNILAFDLPFLAAQAAHQGITWVPPSASADLMDLSALVWPTLGERNLAALCQHTEVDLVEAHRAMADCRATAEVIRRALAAVDASAKGWPLAIQCLHSAEHHLAGLLPQPGPLGAIDDHLVPRPDALIAAASAPKDRDLSVFVRQGFAALATGVGYSPRPSQEDMAREVACSLTEGGGLAIEAPTGTGKTRAYLLPAIAHASNSKSPVVIATATKALQDQLRREAMELHALGVLDVPFRQLMGVSNYICTREVASLVAGDATSAHDLLAAAIAVRALAEAPNGTWDDVNDGHLLRRSAPYNRSRSALRTTAAECERGVCPQRDNCPMMQRHKGIDTWPGVVATNHALVAAWVRATAEGGKAPGDILAAGVGNLVFDEAHQLEDSLTTAWTEKMDLVDFEIIDHILSGRRGPIRLAELNLNEMDADTGAAVKNRLDTLVLHQRQLRVVVGRLDEAIRTYLHEYGGSERSATLTAGLRAGRPELRQLGSALNDTRHAVTALLRGLYDLVALLTAAALAPSRRSRAISRAYGLAKRLEDLASLLDALRVLGETHVWVYRLSLSDEPAEGNAPWTFERIPIDVSPLFTELVVQPARSVVLTSATLTVDQRFDFLASRLGIAVHTDEVGVPGTFRGRRLPSPFNYATQSLVVLTTHLPVPVPVNEREFVEEVAADQTAFLSLTGGRTLGLFAARSRMNAVAAGVRLRAQELTARGVELVVQGELSRAETSRRFRDNPGTVLFGLRSYWEGFDAPGDTLSYLVIEKPPFPSPKDPLIAARQNAISDRGGDPFLDYILPMTAMQFAQGFGRLVRTETDKGAALVLDRRLHSPGPSRRVILGTLPGPTIHEALDRDDAWTAAIEFVTGMRPDIATAVLPPLDRVTAGLADLRLLPGEDPRPKLIQGAKDLFGIDELHPAQLALMCALLEGRDCMGVLPTGFGKSICFQLPALLHPLDRPTVVISPLVALIKDQVDELRGQRGLRPVQGITGATGGVLQTAILRDLAIGKIRLLYVSPERLVHNPPLQGALARQELNGLIVDEAHCVSVWGHDFRPEFRQIPKALSSFRRAPRMGLTATATPRVERDVVKSLDMTNPLVIREPADRPNLRYRVQLCESDAARAREVLRIATAMKGQSGIIYASRRASTEELAGLLRRTGFAARHYHAGMVPEQREAVQEDFRSDNTQIIVATKAFGMGINKPDIAWVLHYDLPDSLDGYAQEAGRAARRRDLTGECVLLYTKQDIARRLRQAKGDKPEQQSAMAQRILHRIGECSTRAGDAVFDATELAEELQIDEDELNVVLARLEDAGAVERQLDTTARGVVAVGVREPIDPEERNRFRHLFRVVLRSTPHTRMLLSFDELAERGVDPDQLEDDLIRWSLDLLVSFSSSRRYWRVKVLHNTVQAETYQVLITDWQEWNGKRLSAVIQYAQRADCRRENIARHFGDKALTCNPSHQEVCDTCSHADPFWTSVPLSEIPDPENLLDVELETLRAVAWTNSYKSGRYGEKSLIAALIGRESMGEGRPIGAGLLNCPQYGALRYLRGAERRATSAVTGLVGSGAIVREATTKGTTSYNTLRLTDAGQRYLKAGHG